MLNTPLIEQSNLHILVADDDPDDIGFFQETLHDLAKEIKFSSVTNGAELMQFLHTTTPDMIILDINLPCKTGIECLSEIRELDNLSTIPIVIYSTATNDRQVDNTYELGANLYFEKPSSYQAMKDGLKKILSYSIHSLSTKVPREEYLIKA